jgi:uncharacterized protein YoxC
MSETDTSNPSLDPRTAEVLRVVQRAKGMVANADPASSPPDSERSSALPRGVHSTGAPADQEAAQNLLLSWRALETALVTATKMLSDGQRSQDRTVQELRGSVQGLKQQADALAGRRARSVAHVAAWGVLLAILITAVAALSWRTQAVASSTHAILEQILDNQARAQAAKSGKRR